MKLLDTLASIIGWVILCGVGLSALVVVGAVVICALAETD